MPHPSEDPNATTETTRPRTTGAPAAPPVHPAPARASAPNVFLFLFGFRLVNALVLSTFFQPDEFFQSLEPAWQMAFGSRSGAWLTWEWRNQLRSSIHPALFACVYRLVSDLGRLLNLSPRLYAQCMIAAPKVTQAVFAASTDYFTWKLGERTYPHHPAAAWAALVLTVISPWQWFCSTRTFSNCLETSLTSAALSYWPWSWCAAGELGDRRASSRNQTDGSGESSHSAGSDSRLRLSLFLAALACILRPTNLLIWICIAVPTLWSASYHRRITLIRESLFCGSLVLAFSLLSDRLYYGVWTFPPLRFLYFNIAQSLAVFYGRNRGDYYLTEGLPLLLTTALPFAAIGVWKALRGPATSPAALHLATAAAATGPDDGGSTTTNEGVSKATGETTPATAALRLLAFTCLSMTLALSLISHKEVRFLYPILPALHVLAAPSFASFFLSPSPSPSPSSTSSAQPRLTRKPLFLLLLTINLTLALYASQTHQRGVIDVLTYLRTEHERALARAAEGHTIPTTNINTTTTTTVAFLMPCHSTPWRSHLVHRDIAGWALTCEPPLDVPPAARPAYLDEADVFYRDPERWFLGGGRGGDGGDDVQQSPGLPPGPPGPPAAWPAWPRYLVFFGQLEGAMGRVREAGALGQSYGECWRTFNSHVHDDWRRVGDVVVWCAEDEEEGGGEGW